VTTARKGLARIGRLGRGATVAGLAVVALGCTAASGPQRSSQLVAAPQTAEIQSREHESKPWFGPMFPPKEPEKPKTVRDWIGQERLDP
jgi:hypothetical protein